MVAYDARFASEVIKQHMVVRAKETTALNLMYQVIEDSMSDRVAVKRGSASSKLIENSQRFESGKRDNVLSFLHLNVESGLAF